MFGLDRKRFSEIVDGFYRRFGGEPKGDLYWRVPRSLAGQSLVRDDSRQPSASPIRRKPDHPDSGGDPASAPPLGMAQVVDLGRWVGFEQDATEPGVRADFLRDFHAACPPAPAS